MDNTATIRAQEQQMLAGWYADPQDPNTERWWDGQQWGQETRSAALAEGSQHSEIDALPVLKGWKEHSGFDIFGLAVSVAIVSIINNIIDIDESYAIPAAVALSVYLTIGIVYVFAFYPSYFKEKPLIRSNKAICFLNYFCGGLILGYLRNHNLKRSHEERRALKGVSYIVAGILFSVSLACSAALACLILI